MWQCPHYKCEACHQSITYPEKDDDNVTCLVPAVVIDGVQYRRQKYHFDEEDGRCHDCLVKHGGIHHAYCDVEKCPVCDEQLIGCDCENKQFPFL